MGRPKRASTGGMIFHVLNRANGRQTIFEHNDDYANHVASPRQAPKQNRKRFLTPFLGFSGPQQVLRRMKHPRQPGQRLSWEWVLDFFHVCGYVSKLREALFGQEASGYRWYQRMRRWLRDRDQGVAQVLRSAMQHYHRQRLSAGAQEEFWKAYRYLRNHRRWMEYSRYRRQGLPIGSGVTEAACKTVFTQRLKRSGMRWHGESGQVIVDLRVLYLSGIWSEVVRRDLQSRALPEPVKRPSSQPQVPTTLKKAA